MRAISRRNMLVGTLGLLAAGSAALGPDSVAGPVTADEYGDQNQTLPRQELPDFASSRGARVAALYRFAVERGKDLEHIPCYCGCGNIGHRSNRQCYVKSENQDGAVTFTSHAAT